MVLLIRDFLIAKIGIGTSENELSKSYSVKWAGQDASVRGHFPAQRCLRSTRMLRCRICEFHIFLASNDPSRRLGCPQREQSSFWFASSISKEEHAAATCKACWHCGSSLGDGRGIQAVNGSLRILHAKRIDILRQKFGQNNRKMEKSRKTVNSMNSIRVLDVVVVVVLKFA